jgi:hypothetical protein
VCSGLDIHIAACRRVSGAKGDVRANRKSGEQLLWSDGIEWSRPAPKMNADKEVISSQMQSRYPDQSDG